MLISSGIDPSWFGDGRDGNVYLTKWAHIATTAALPAYTVGPPGTLTANVNGNLTIDGGGTSNGLILLVKNQSGALQVDNGLYDIVQSGSGGTPWILTRHASFNDSNTDGIKQGTAVHINSGNSNIDTIWRLNNKLVEALLGSTVNVSIAAGALPVVDGVQVTEGMRVFLKNQTDNTTNGVYIASASGWTRVPELNADAEFANNIHVYVDRGTTNGATYWRCDQVAVTVGSSAITFSSSLDAVTIGIDRLTFSSLNVAFFAGPNTFTDGGGTDAFFSDFVIDMPDPDTQAPRNIHLRGCKIHVKNKFSLTCADTILTTVEHIKIHNDGQHGDNGVNGGPRGSLGGGTSGGASVVSSNGLAGGNQTSDSSLGRGGGDGGASSGFTGGNNGQATYGTASFPDYRTISILHRGYVDSAVASTVGPLWGGAGGGSGGSNGGTSGAGGGGGGILWICAAKMHVNAGNQSKIVLCARGGHGGDAFGSFAGGGGGGGGGGAILLHGGLTKTGTGLFIVDASGGDGGDGNGPEAGDGLGGQGGVGGRALQYDMARGELIEVLSPNGVDGADDT